MKNDIQSKFVDNKNLPKHLAIIMDGNARWAKMKGLPRSFGHKEGVKAVKKIISSCLELNIPVLTLFAFSTENWKRSKNEVSFLIRLFNETLEKEKENLNKNNIRVNFLGRIKDFPDILVKNIIDLVELTKNNNKLILNIAINYGGRAEIVDAIKSIVWLVSKKKVRIEEIDEEIVRNNLYTYKLPDPDLLIRTAGEMRISNFMLWQIAYTEFWVTPLYWPDFDKNSLIEAIRDFQKRVRKFGGRV
ncbi:MAG TPA: isoprenyl transferase [Candidatus Atribacteria bacterium]|nr:isoprenyl transferase [Candidatus Atribacteria bacterium]